MKYGNLVWGHGFGRAGSSPSWAKCGSSTSIGHRRHPIQDPTPLNFVLDYTARPTRQIKFWMVISTYPPSHCQRKQSHGWSSWFMTTASLTKPTSQYPMIVFDPQLKEQMKTHRHHHQVLAMSFGRHVALAPLPRRYIASWCRSLYSTYFPPHDSDNVLKSFLKRTLATLLFIASALSYSLRPISISLYV